MIPCSKYPPLLSWLVSIVSDPDHRRYGQHLNAAEVNELVRPTDTALELAHGWLQDHNITRDELEYSPAKDWIKISLPVNAIERLLDTKYSIFKHEDGTYMVRAPEWSLPVHLHEYIEAIQPTTSFFRAKPLGSNVKPVKSIAESESLAQVPQSPTTDLTLAQACNASAVTPLCLRTLYDTIHYTPKVPGQNKVGLNDFLGESNNRSDIHIFLEQFRPEAAAAAYEFNFIVIAGGSDQQSPDNATQLAAGTDLEGNLDAETILGIDYPTPLTAFTTGGTPPFLPDDLTPTDTNEPYLTWVNYVLGQNDLPQVISTSYGDDEQTVPKSYAKTVCRGFAQLGARGISILVASGDNGVGPAKDCLSNDGKNTSIFLPEFPASCPYVTTVGATKNFNPEVVAVDPENGFVSGGGFSNYFPRPAYQKSVVDAYVAGLDGEYNGLYNPSGRGYPDIAAQGYHFLTIWNGSIAVLDGTSASTPTASAVLALVNDALLAAGRPTLGFLNPWLYKHGYKAFTDVTSGSSIGCGTAGFPAEAGWDAVTGFGTPVSRQTFQFNRA